jgi:hypothetical protein
MRCFPILGWTPSLDVFPSHWSHLCCASTASISPPSLDGMDISHQRMPPHVVRCISHRNGWSALLRCSSCPLDCSSQLGPTPHALDTIQAIQHIHTTLSAAPTRSRPCAAVHYGITMVDHAFAAANANPQLTGPPARPQPAGFRLISSTMCPCAPSSLPSSIGFTQSGYVQLNPIRRRRCGVTDT